MAEQNKQPSSAAQPGQVITPGGVSNAAVKSAQASSASSSAPPPATPNVTSDPPTASPDNDIPEDRKQLYRSAFTQEGRPVEPVTAEEAPGDNVSWTASEFVAHEKSAGWYGGLTAAAMVIAAFVYLVTKDIISTIVVLVCAAVFGILGRKKPRQLQYHLDSSGIMIGSKRYTYEMFRSFSVVPEGAFSSIVFMPLKRFAPLTTIYYAPKDESKIVTILSDRLPFEERKADAIDSLMRRIRF